MISDFLEFTLLTGLRKQESLSLKFSDVSFDGNYIRVRASQAKNHNEHQLPLSDHLRTLLKRRELCRDGSNYVFPGQKPDTHLQEPKRGIAAVREQSKVKFMIHDLRRTFLSVAHSLGYEVYTLKRLANHSTGGDVTAGYIVVQPKHLQQEAMQRITDYILEQAKGKDIVTVA